MVAEMLQAPDEMPAKLGKTHAIPFSFNFVDGTSRSVVYTSSGDFHALLNKVIRQIKRNDLALGTMIDLHKRGRKTAQ